MARRFVEGEKIDVGFDGKRCIHSRNCVLGLPKAFVPNAPGEWLYPNEASVDAIVQIVESCPSGALTYKRKDGSTDEAPPPVNTVRLRENGPLVLHGDLEIDGEKMLRATLCRCGASSRKPFCDNSHNKIDFAATGEPASKESAPLESRGGLLKVIPQPNGFLRLEGNMEIVTGNGRTVDRATKAFFCRCGHSGNKPFCDSTHKKIGFQA
jgi:CDGSH-type Zn-finger protein/uncharacterized Fe-S cluster protein YjdI